MALDIEKYPTILHLLRQRSVEWRDTPAMYHKDLGIWLALSWGDYYTRICKVAAACRAIGLMPGAGAAILSENRPEWLAADYGSMICGLLSNGVYTTSSVEQITYQLQASQSEILYVEDGELLEKALAMDEDDLARLKKIVVFDMTGLENLHHPLCIDFDSFIAIGEQALASNPAQIDQMLDQLVPETIGILIFTSGTTGLPKAAMISHRNIMVQVREWSDHYPLTQADRVVCYLPLCHIAERQFSGLTVVGTGTVVYFSESMEALGENLREVKPTILFAPPRVYEKLSAMIDLAMAEARPSSQWVYNAARQQIIKGAAKPVRWLLRKTVLNNVLRLMGLSELRVGLTGAAAVSTELVDWFHSIGVPMYELFGMTETSGAVSEANFSGTHRFCGPPIKVGEVRIGENDELLVKGPHVFAGYFNDPEKTREAIDSDGWLHTGDQARFDDENNLQIIGRIKDLLITSGGKNIAPSKIESKIKTSPYIMDAMLVGDGRKFITTLVMIDQETVSRYARDNGISYTDYSNLCGQPAVHSLIDKEINSVNDSLARVEQIKDFRIIDVDLDAEDDELTPTLKLKRRKVEQNYVTSIDEMYANT